jgi:RNA polymerase sigma factor (sigma-70 family)
MKSEAVVRQFRRLLEPGTIAGLTERQVLERFAERGDPVAFEAIVARHGPLVFAVCRQLLRDPNDVDDAFQGTFLIFIKKAATLRQPERLGPWLYGVAYRVALRARMRRRNKELPEDLAGPRLSCSAEDNEQFEALHNQIQRLPEKYRVPIVLCCIEGLSPNEAARQLGWPVGTVHGRLSRARDLLRDRLTRRGILVTDGVADALALFCPRRTVLPEAMRQAAVRLLGATVPRSLETFTKGVLFAMITEKLKQTGIVVAMSVIALGTVTMALVAYEGPLAKPGRHATDSAVQDGERNKSHETKAIPVAKTAVDEPKQRENQARLRAEAELEESHQKLDQLFARAALMQIALDTTTKRIEKAIEFIEGPASRSVDALLTAQEREPVMKDLHERTVRMNDQLERDKMSYTAGWTDLARLKRQIARQSKMLGVTSELAPTGTELGRRLDALEKKIDRIIDALPAK